MQIFGGKKISGLGKSLGKNIKEFKEEIEDNTDKKEKIKEVNADKAENDN